MILLDLFSGIGGFSLAASWVWGKGLEILAFCEKDPFCQKVLKKHWPDVPIISDIKDATKENVLFHTKRLKNWRGKVDIITGGFPCQPFSVAGQRKSTEDDRYLWPEMLRTILEIRPRWVVAENVYGILTVEDGMVFERICSSLEKENYEVQSYIIPACGKNAPHKRNRVWIIANSNNDRFDGETISICWKKSEEVSMSSRSNCDASHYECLGWKERPFKEVRSKEQIAERQIVGNTNPTNIITNDKCWRLERRNKQTYFKCRENIGENWQESWYSVAFRTCIRGMDDGISRGIHRVNRLKALGNAIVPQIAQQIFLAMKYVDENIGL